MPTWSSFALEPLVEEERGSGARTRVSVEGIPELVVASRTERAILTEIGVTPSRSRRLPQNDDRF